jgi:hypothetical protein
MARPVVRVGAGGVLVVELAARPAELIEKLAMIGLRSYAEQRPGWRASPAVGDALGHLRAVIAANDAHRAITSDVGSESASPATVLAQCVTSAEAGELLGTSARWVGTLADEGRLPARRSTAGWLLWRPSVIDLAIERKVS